MASNNKNESYTIKNGLCVVINIKYFIDYEILTRIDSHLDRYDHGYQQPNE